MARIAAILVGLTMSGVVCTGVSADPRTGTDSEGGSAKLHASLAAASHGYQEAHAKRVASERREQALAQRERATRQRIEADTIRLGRLAAAAYRGGHAGVYVSLLRSGSATVFVEAMSSLNQIGVHYRAAMEALSAARAELAGQRSAIALEIGRQLQHEKTMAIRRNEAERALAIFDGRPTAGYGDGPYPAAGLAPRLPDGTLARESCSRDDPTTSGCLTPRTLNALLEAKLAGFTRYVSCFRVASFGEHPKGRACDFAVAVSGFGDTAYGGDRAYGDQLAAWFVSNAERLGVLYVIWYRQIWMPGLGWRAYSGGGSPSAAHTNHVHLSMQ